MKKDIAMTSMEYLEEDSILPAYLEYEEHSPTYQKFNTNVLIISTRNQSGLKVNDTLIHNALQCFPTVISDKENNQL